MKTWINKLIKEKIGSDKIIKQNNFMVIMEQFANYIETITQDIDNLVKCCQKKTAKILR